MLSKWVFPALAAGLVDAQCSTTFSKRNITRIKGSRPFEVVTADLDGDSALDALSANNGDDTGPDVLLVFYRRSLNELNVGSKKYFSFRVSSYLRR